jgi:hypothetical protein
MRSMPRCLAALPFIAFILGLSAGTAQAEDWRPVTREELAMQAEPAAPGAPAVYLYRQIDRDDVKGREVVYEQVKILTAEGRKYGDIEISYNGRRESIRQIEARTIRPDGSIVPFDGKVYEKPIVESTGARLLLKTFTMPEAEVGSVVEYRYLRLQADTEYIYDSRWVLSAGLFTRYAKFSLQPSQYFPIVWNWPHGLPAETTPPKSDQTPIRMEARNIPAAVTEEYMPPEDEMKFRVNFVYVSNFTPVKDPETFWRSIAKDRYGRIHSFVDKERAMKEAVATIVAPSDDTDTKLRKIYARCQTLRNTALERERTQQEREREKIRAATSVVDVWKNGYGDGIEIAWLFLGLVRAAGIEADPVLVAPRDRYFFSSKLMDPTPLNSNVIDVKLDGKHLYLDPGVAYTPYGLLPWSETGVQGLRITKQGGEWVSMPYTRYDDSKVLRKAELKLTDQGALEGRVTYTFTGLEAQWRRAAEHEEDDAERREFLENGVKRDVPTGVDVKLLNQPEWRRSDVDLVAEFELRVPGYASPAGGRTLFPVGLFSSTTRGIFKSETRVNPLYFQFPSLQSDDITVALPAGWKVDSLPRARRRDLGKVAFTLYGDDRGDSLRLRRDLARNMVFLPETSYNEIRQFFQFIQAGDEEQVVLSRGTPPAPLSPQGRR